MRMENKVYKGMSGDWGQPDFGPEIYNGRVWPVMDKIAYE